MYLISGILKHFLRKGHITDQHPHRTELTGIISEDRHDVDLCVFQQTGNGAHRTLFILCIDGNLFCHIPVFLSYCS